MANPLFFLKSIGASATKLITWIGSSKIFDETLKGVGEKAGKRVEHFLEDKRATYQRALFGLEQHEKKRLWDWYEYVCDGQLIIDNRRWNENRFVNNIIKVDETHLLKFLKDCAELPGPPLKYSVLVSDENPEGIEYANLTEDNMPFILVLRALDNDKIWQTINPALQGLKKAYHSVVPEKERRKELREKALDTFTEQTLDRLTDWRDKVTDLANHPDVVAKIERWERKSKTQQDSAKKKAIGAIIFFGVVFLGLIVSILIIALR